MKANPLILPLIGAPPLMNLSPLADDTLAHVTGVAKISYKLRGKYAEHIDMLSDQDWRNVLIHVFAVGGGQTPSKAPDEIQKTVDAMLTVALADKLRGEPATDSRWGDMPKEISDILTMLDSIDGVKVLNASELLDDDDDDYPQDSKHVLMPDSRTTFVLMTAEIQQKGESFTYSSRAFRTKDLAIEYVKSRAPHPHCVRIREKSEKQAVDHTVPPVTIIGYHGKTVATITEVTVHRVLPE